MDSDNNELTRSLLNDYIYYFLIKVESKFNFYLNILEGNPEESKISLTGNILSTAAIAIPVIGKGASSGLKEGDKILSKKIDKDNSIILSSIIYYHRNNKEKVRNMLIQALYEIFCCYEKQFKQIDCNGGAIRAIQKLGYDAGKRYLDYLIKNKCETISCDIVVNSIIMDTSNFLNKLGLVKTGLTVKNTNEYKWDTSKIYTNVGIYYKEENTYYKRKGVDAEMYGHRLIFSHEHIDEIKNEWELDVTEYVKYDYKMDIRNFDDEFPNILKYIYSKNPDEFSTYDRNIKHEALLYKINETSDNAQADRERINKESTEHREILHHVALQETHKELVEVKSMLEKITETREVKPETPTCSIDTQEIVDLVEQKIEQMNDGTINLRINKDRINKELKKLDPTRTGEGQKIKKKLRKLF